MATGFSQTVRQILGTEDDEEDDQPPMCPLSSCASLVDVEQAQPVDSRRLAHILRRRQRSVKGVLSRMLDQEEPTLGGGCADSGDDSEDAVALDFGTLDMDSPGRAAGIKTDCTDDSGDDSTTEQHDWEREPSIAQRCCDSAKKRLSIIEWFPRMTSATVQADLLAGLTVCVMVIPQSMSYANIAGLPYIYGMYSACVPTLLYALFGQSRQLAVGPVAMVSLILRAGLQGKLNSEQCPEWYNDDAPRVDGVYQNQICTDAYIVMACSVSAMIGLIKIGACLFRLSFLVSFLGHPVISGFSTGSAVIIGCSQLKYFLGVKLPSTDHVHELVAAIFEKLPEAKPAPMILGFLWLFFLILTKRLSRKHKSMKALGPLGPLICCIAGSLLVWLWPALREEYHVKHVGEVPGGIFPWSGGNVQKQLTWAQFQNIQVTAFSAALIGFMESIAIAKNLAEQHKYPIDAGQELLALGVANVVGACFSCYPVTGSFSRSAVANTTGAQTQLAGIITALGMLLVLLFLTPVFYYLPMFALAAVVLNSVLSLIAYDVAIELFRVKKWDFLLWLVAFLGTLFIGPLEGIGIAVVLSLGVVIYESVRPAITILWRVPGTGIFRSIDQETVGQFVPGIFIVRIGASMYFANATYVKDLLLKYIEDMGSVDKTEYLILEMTGVATVDSTAAHVLRDIVNDFRARNIQTAFAMVGRRCLRTMEKSKLVKQVGESWFFPTVDQAVRGCLRHRHDSAGPHLNFTASEPEVGVSNDLHHLYTTLTVLLPMPIANVLPILTNVISSSGCRVVNAQVDSTHQLFHLACDEGKLKTKDAEALRRKVVDTLDGIFRGTSRRKSSRMRTTESLVSVHSNTNEAWEAVAEELARERVEILEATSRAQQLEAKLVTLGKMPIAG